MDLIIYFNKETNLSCNYIIAKINSKYYNLSLEFYGLKNNIGMANLKSISKELDEILFSNMVFDIYQGNKNIGVCRVL
jgi:hypothetical protein